MNIQCKRVYDPAEQSDGYRILVDRLWPRGIKKTDLALDEWGNDSNLLIVFYVQIMPDDFVMQLHRF